MKRKTEKMVMSLVALTIAVAVWVLRFQHAELTEAQFFLEFWWIWVSLLGVAVVGAIVSHTLDQDQ